MLARLDGNLVKRLHAAIMDAFTHTELQQFVRTSLDARLEEISLNATGLSDVVAALISWAERRFRIPDLVDGLVQDRPTNPIFEQLHDELRAQLKHGLRAGSGWGIEGAPPPVLGRAPVGVEPAALLRWASGLADATRGVCLVEIGDVAATGFALGPRLVLTVRHVMADVIEGRRDPAEVRIRFGWATPTPDAPSEGGLWELDRGMGTVDEDTALDFALLLLGSPAEPHGSGMLVEQMEALRGSLATVHALDTTAVVPAEGDPLFLLGHPLGKPVEVEPLRALTSNDPTRVRYSLGGPGRPGTSGAPIFDARWRVVGLHRGLTPPGDDGLAVGEAVWIGPILERAVVRVAQAVSRPPPERVLEQMAI